MLPFSFTLKSLKKKTMLPGGTGGRSNFKPRVSTAGLAILLLCFTVLPGFFSPGQIITMQGAGQTVASFNAASLPSNRPFDYLLIILMENKNFNQINGSASAPYLNHLAHNYSLATRYTACDHPSLPNYMCLTGGNNYFSGVDCSPTGPCTTSNSSIVDRVESAGLTWRAYIEDMPSPCYTSAFKNYTYLTNPFVFYTRIAGNSTRCAAHVVPANTGGKGLPDDNLLNALSSKSTASNYMWLTPNLCDNMHGLTGSCPTSIPMGDRYLSSLVPLVLNSFIFRTQKAALFITFDEGFGYFPTDYVYTVWAGPAVKIHYQSSIQYSHYSLTTTIESAWGLQPLTSKDEGSTAMDEFFLPPSSPQAPLIVNFTFFPADPAPGLTVNFSGSAVGGTQPYVYRWFFGNGDRGTGQTIGYAYQHIGNYTANLAVVDASGQTATTSKAISIDTDPSPAGTCLGCAKTTLPRTLGLIISFAIGVTLPLAGAMILSKWRRRSDKD